MRIVQALRRPRILLSLGVAVAAGVSVAACTAQAGMAPAAAVSNSSDQPPAGFTEHKVKGIDYVIGGKGPTLVLIHGYPETWLEWKGVMPALAKHYTVIAPDLPGAGKSDAPATLAAYDKKTMAADIHQLLVQIGKDRGIRIVGHDIGTMVSYSYAAAYPKDVTKLVLSEAPIPDPSIYQFPALTATGPGLWNFGFFNISNGLPEDMIQGRETEWVGRFIDQFEFVKGAVTPADVQTYGSFLRDRAHLEASFDWFRVFPQDIKDDAVDQKTKLTMPVLAIGADHSLGATEAKQVKQYATNVTGMVIPNSGHWIYEEHPAEMTQILLKFLQ